MLAAIDWTRPWYDAVRPAWTALALAPDATSELDAADDVDAVSDIAAAALVAAFNARAAALALHNAAGQPLRFVPQSALPEGRAYEEFIGATGCVPTRDNLHDFFNALVWLTFPQIKVQLNALQAAQIALAGVGKSRGPARDGATIFDENAALLVVREGAPGDALIAALRAHDWRAALYDGRAADRADGCADGCADGRADARAADRAVFGPDAQLWLFGHALMEKLVAPRKAITAHTRVVRAHAGWFALAHDARRAWLDTQVAAGLAADGLSTAAFTPLPVLGVPGWWPQQDDVFYADTSVFRPKRASN